MGWLLNSCLSLWSSFILTTSFCKYENFSNYTKLFVHYSKATNYAPHYRQFIKQLLNHVNWHPKFYTIYVFYLKNFDFLFFFPLQSRMEFKFSLNFCQTESLILHDYDFFFGEHKLWGMKYILTYLIIRTYVLRHSWHL